MVVLMFNEKERIMKRIVLIAVVSMFCMGQVFAAMLSEGTRRLEVSGRIDETEEVNVSLGCAAGYFIQDNVEIGILGSYVGTHGGDDQKLSLGAYSEYNIVLDKESLFVPYVGAAGALTYASRDWGVYDEDNTVLEVSGYVGVRYFIVDNVAIGTAARLFYATDDIYIDGDGKMEDSIDWDIILNTSFYF
jgi:hypothetical protein